MLDLELTRNQKETIYKLMDWYRNPESDQIFTIDGVSGSGKSTLISMFAEFMKFKPGDYIYSCFTGKAVNVLSAKGVPACTIHRLIYHTKKKRDKKTKKLEYEFKLKSKDELDYKIIILDEYSMISKKLFNDLKSFGIKLVLTGDSNQLPPVRDNGIITNIDVRLTEVMRQKKNSPILKLASKILNGQSIGYGALSDKVAVIKRDELPDELLCNPDYQIICGYNSTRSEINNKIRKMKGNYGRYPTIGDRVTCTANDWSLLISKNMALTNGMQGTITKISFPEDRHYSDDDQLNSNKKKDHRWWTFYAEILFDGVDEPVSLYINRACFDNTYSDLIDEEIGHWFEYGYAITTHKAQGSEWNNVIVFNEPVGDPKKWLYTAITRAKESLILVI